MVDIKNRIRRTFNEAAADYDQHKPSFFSYFGKRAVELSNISSGARVLDVGTGRGALLFPALEKVGSQGEVIGIDISTKMLRYAGLEFRKRKTSNAKLLHMDAERLNFPNASFDVVLCGFVLFFFSDPKIALGECHRVLKQGGKIIITTSGKPDLRWRWFGQLLDKYNRQEILVNSALTISRLRRLLYDSRFRQARILKEEKTFFYEDEKTWWNTYMSHGGVRDAISQMKKPTRDKFKKEAMSLAHKLRERRGLRQKRRVLFTIGIK